MSVKTDAELDEELRKGVKEAMAVLRAPYAKPAGMFIIFKFEYSYPFQETKSQLTSTLCYHKDILQLLLLLLKCVWSPVLSSSVKLC